ncbi:pilus assembly FimT family protein [Agarivorans sp. QJM3NY_25]|uniref:pilus assembly FimT family protein n=1 Tax=Agarivorans sp. QJM3NY_25 TaxID=3421430 RepID=UPI003F6C544A
MHIPLRPHCRYTGFTLVELVITLILIAILAVTVAPKFLRSGVDELSLREQLVSRLQLVQTQAMNSYPDENNNHQRCFFLQIDAHSYYSGEIDTSGRCRDQPIGPTTVEFSERLTVSQGKLVFNGMGRVILADSSLCRRLPCRITIQGEQSQAIVIEAEGYIHAE